MYESHPSLITPNDSETIWRYFDFAGFLSLIANGTLYFRRCDKFEDNWEARYSILPRLTETAFPDAEGRTRALRSYLASQEDMRSVNFANCWHRGQHEDAAMWEIYTARRSGIAIQSNIARLKKALQGCSRKMWIGEVIYRDFQQPDLAEQNSLPLASFVKREEYKFEKEVRVLVWSRLPHPPLAPGEPDIARDDVGFPCPVDIRSLIESVVIAPAVSANMVTAVQQVMDKFDLGHIAVRHSKLAEAPPTLASLDSDEPKVFTLTMRMEEPMLKLLMRACEDYHTAHYNDTAPIHSVELVTAIKGAAWDAGYSSP